MIAYILKSSLCLMLLWGFYKLFLEKENIHFLKRFYLLFSLVFAFTVPLITLTYEVEVDPQPEIILDTAVPLMMNATEISEVQEPVDYLSISLWSLYGIGVLIFGIRFIRNLMDIRKKVRKNERLKEISHVNVLLGNSIVPHTFLDYIFVPKKEFQEKKIPQEILLHEKTHVLQKHTLDILFVELLQVIVWFNPMFIFMKRAIRLNHEFLADQNVLKQKFAIQDYFDLLLNYKNSTNQAELSSAINYSLTKKRLQMMTKNFSRKRATLKLLAVLPLLAIGLLSFNNEIVAKEIVKETPADPMDSVDLMIDANKDIKLGNNENTIVKVRNLEKDKISKTIAKKSPNTSNKKITTVDKSSEKKNLQDGVTEEMVKEYNIWAKDLNTKIEGNKPINITQSNIYRMIYIYRNMTAEQRERSEQFPDIPPPPPAPEAPRVQKGEESDIPPPPPPAPEAPEAPSKGNGSYVEVKFAEDSELTEEEKEEYIERIEAQLAEAREEEERMLEEIRAEEMEVLAESQQLIAEAEIVEQENRRDAIAGITEAEVQRVTAMEQIQEAREAAERARDQAFKNAQEARAIAREQAQQSREHSEKAMRNAELQARKAEREVRKEEMKARRKALEAERKAQKARVKAEVDAYKAELDARKVMRKAEMQARKAESKARKVEMEARRKAIAAEMEARKAEQKRMMISDPPSTKEFIKNMAKKDADFYYNGKKISAKKALKLIEDSGNPLSIDASTKNGKSKVIIKD
ncbi:M56 family metallopeptidase [Aquimarina litoralis]|uniref:M56 family metallopeptidase n=1 Tax=Aquimarina litoralis TaxID=584605 RepID=UPI001C55FE2A|nr:M56 family metallopeptidase [Aquimarina litoralis]MBW1296001.1 hypothetical protein [Aquimarina litoralis]